MLFSLLATAIFKVSKMGFNIDIAFFLQYKDINKLYILCIYVYESDFHTIQPFYNTVALDSTHFMSMFKKVLF